MKMNSSSSSSSSSQVAPSRVSGIEALLDVAGLQRDKTDRRTRRGAYLGCQLPQGHQFQGPIVKVFVNFNGPEFNLRSVTEDRGPRR
jgi:hypothetical protein